MLAAAARGRVAALPLRGARPPPPFLPPTGSGGGGAHSAAAPRPLPPSSSGGGAGAKRRRVPAQPAPSQQPPPTRRLSSAVAVGEGDAAAAAAASTAAVAARRAPTVVLPAGHRALVAGAPPPTAAVPSPLGVGLPIGVAAGALGGAAGLGGAVFSIPLLVRYGGLAQRAAAGTALTAVIGTATASALTFGAAGHLDVGVAAVLGAAAAAGAPLGVAASARLPAGVLRKALGGFLMLLAPGLPARQVWMARREEDAVAATVAAAALAADHDARDSRDGDAVAVVVATAASAPSREVLVGGGLAAGFVSGVLGVSGGGLLVPLLAVAAPAWPIHTVVGTAFAAMVPAATAAAATYGRAGLVAGRWVTPLLTGTVVGGAGGAAAGLAAPEEVLRGGVALVLGAMGWRVWRGGGARARASPQPPKALPVGCAIAAPEEGLGGGAGAREEGWSVTHAGVCLPTTFFLRPPPLIET